MAIESRSNQYGTVFDGWQITKKLGRGSNGKTAVYQLTRKDDDWEETCALKVITLIEEKGVYEELSPSRQEEYKQALKQRISDAKQEVRLMEKLRGNTNIVDYLDHRPRTWKKTNSFGCDMMIRMELLHDLRSEIAEGRIFTEAEIIKIGKDICNALILCHGKDILHRDIKPENIFFNDDGNYKLGDFGVSRILDACPDATASTGIGTYEYWPAEQMTGRYDKRVDIYSLGLVLYELSNRNRLPFAASTYLTGSEVPMRLAGKPLPAPSEASPALAQVILKACAFNPDERYQSAEEFLKALNRGVRPVQNVAKSKTPQVSTRQEQAHDDYATALAKELGLPESIFADDLYETIPAEGNKISQNNSFETQPAQQAITSYETVPAEQVQAQEIPIKRQKGKKRPVAVLSAIAVCLILLIGTMMGTILTEKNRNEEDDLLLSNTELSQSRQSEEASAPETLPQADTSEASSKKSTADETTIPETETVKMKTVYLRTSYVDENNNMTYEYNDDGTIFKFFNQEDEEHCVLYYIYDDGALMEQIDSLNSSVSPQVERDAMIQKLNAILNNPTDSNIQYRIMTLDDRNLPIRVSFLNKDLSVLLDSSNTYNGSGKKLRSDDFYNDNEVREVHHSYQYDEHGNLIRQEHISPSPSYLNTATEYIYNAGGKVVERKEINFLGASEDSASSKTITHWKYTYDANGLLSEEVEYTDWGTATGAYSRYDVYDDVGNVVQEHHKWSANGQDTIGYYTYKEVQIPVNQLDRLRTIYNSGALNSSYINIPNDVE